MDDEEAMLEGLVSVVIASHGDRAASVLTERIEDCRRNGDTEGVRVWEKVAARVSMQSLKRK